MNPPPPMFPASGQVTARANADATAASAAFPPCRSTSAPIADAIGQTETTTPCGASMVGPDRIGGGTDAAGAGGRLGDAQPTAKARTNGMRQRGIVDIGGSELASASFMDWQVDQL